MLKKGIYILGLFLVLSGCQSIEKPKQIFAKPLPALIEFKPGERIMILAPHPDDEAIACAGIIQQALKVGAKVKIVYLTNGDHNELAFIVYEKRLTFRRGEFIYMGQVRQKESIRAMQFLGLQAKDLVFLGYPDYGTFNIFSQYWQTAKPFRDRLTRISSVPYRQNPSYGAPYYGENILHDLTNQIRDYQPDKIFVSHPADVNADHKSLYLFLQIALSDLEASINAPQVYPYLVHCVGWPKPRHYHPELGLSPPEKYRDSDLTWERYNLSSSELDKKYQAILVYKSQTQSSAFYLFSFARENELFGDYPVLELKAQSKLNLKLTEYSGAQALERATAETEEIRLEDALEYSGQVSFAKEDNNFIVRLDRPKQLSKNFGVLLYVFGYNHQIPFAQMPKISIITAGNKYKVFNLRQKVLNSGVSLEFAKYALILKIPLPLLGEPDYLLTSLKAYHGRLPIDVVGFRKIKLK